VSVKETLPLGTTLTGAILATDKTHLTNFSGDKVMYPAYISIGNIYSETRRKLNNHAFMVFAYLPVTKFPNTDFTSIYKSKTAGKKMPSILAKRLFHRCMSVVLTPFRDRTPRQVIDAEGYTRSIVTVIIAYISDHEEQTMLAGVRNFQCPNCKAGFDELDHASTCPPRTSESILHDIACARRRDPDVDTWGFALNAFDLGLCGVEHPWWMDLGIDIGRVICQDALHGLHKAFRDHDLKWIQTTIGTDELDRRFRAQPHRTGIRSFPKGISHISQWSGKEDRDVQRIILGAIAGAENASPSVVNAVRSRLDFMYLAQLPQHTDTTLQLMRSRLTEYNKARLVFIRNGARCGKNGVIEHMKIPKAHANSHFEEGIKDTGAVDNYSTETPETYHIASCKEPWKESNRKDFMIQVIRRLTRHAAIHMYSSYLEWRGRDAQGQSGDDPAADDESITFAHGLIRLRLAKVPHFHGIGIQSIMRDCTIPGLLAAIVRYDSNVDSGFALFQRGIFHVYDLPQQYEELDIWTSMRIHPDRPNKFFQEETFTVHCKPATAESAESFDPVLIQVQGSPSGRFNLEGTLSESCSQYIL
jgi:hypothetical protein